MIFILCLYFTITFMTFGALHSSFINERNSNNFQIHVFWNISQSVVVNNFISFLFIVFLYAAGYFESFFWKYGKKPTFFIFFSYIYTHMHTQHVQETITRGNYNSCCMQLEHITLMIDKKTKEKNRSTPTFWYIL